MYPRTALVFRVIDEHYYGLVSQSFVCFLILFLKVLLPIYTGPIYSSITFPDAMASL